MLCAPTKCLHHLRNINSGFIAVTNNCTFTSTNIRTYSKDTEGKDKDCCKPIPNTELEIKQWPKDAPLTPGWRKECSTSPQPPNYDPYKIKVPNTVVSPLATKDAQEFPTEDVYEVLNDPVQYLGSTHDKIQNICNPAAVPTIWKENSNTKLTEEKQQKYISVKLGYHGKNKYKYAFHEPWKPLDRITLLQQAEKEEMELVENVASTDK